MALKSQVIPASIQGIVDAPPEKKIPEGAQDLLNLIPRPSGLELRKGFKHYKDLPEDSAPIRLISLSQFGDNQRQENIWSMLIAITNEPNSSYQLEWQRDGEDQALTDAQPTILPVTGGRQLFRNSVFTEYTDLAGNKSIVVVSGKPVIDQGLLTISSLWFLSTTTENRVPFEGANTFRTHLSGTRDGEDEAFTNVRTDHFSYVLEFQNRLFFMESDTASVYYPRIVKSNPVQDLIVDKFELDFRKGQNLFMSTISNDTGQGPDDYIAFVSTEGEVLIYAMSNIDAEEVRYVGRFEIGKPLGGVNSHTEINGDCLVATEWGFISILSNMKDSALTGNANAAINIPDTWRRLVEETRGQGDWWVQKIPNVDKFIVISPPAQDSLLWAIDTKAWTKIDKTITSVAEYAGRTLYSAGNSVFTYEGGVDTELVDGAIVNNPLVGKWFPRPNLLGTTTVKNYTQCELNYTSKCRVANRIFINDYYKQRVNLPPSPLQSQSQTENPQGIKTGIKDVFGEGQLIAPATLVSISEEDDPNTCLTSMTAYYELGSAQE